MHLPVPRMDALPAGLVMLDDFERHAAQVLDAGRYAYFAGGAADHHTLMANRQAWTSMELMPRVLRPLANGHTRTSLQGQMLDWPLMLAPVAHQCLAHPDGEIATAHAALACTTGMVLSTQSSVAVEEVQAVLQSDGVGAAPACWFQLYWQPVRAQTRALVNRAEQAGCQAIVLTVDAPVQGVRDVERRTAFTLPRNCPSPHLDALPAAPPASRTLHGLCQGIAARAAHWDDVQWLLQQTSLPVWLKGISHPQDAQLAQAAGVAGIIVSNHGGRTLDTVPATAHLLPAIRRSAGPDYPILVDGGIRRGTDIFKALALGANATLLGRPQVFGLAAAGAVGVSRMLRLLRDEFEACMTLCGCASVADISVSHLFAGCSLPSFSSSL